MLLNPSDRIVLRSSVPSVPNADRNKRLGGPHLRRKPREPDYKQREGPTRAEPCVRNLLCGTNRAEPSLTPPPHARRERHASGHVRQHSSDVGQRRPRVGARLQHLTAVGPLRSAVMRWVYRGCPRSPRAAGGLAARGTSRAPCTCRPSAARAWTSTSCMRPPPPTVTSRTGVSAQRRTASATTSGE